MGAFSGAMPLKLSGAIGGTGCTAATAQYRFVKISADLTVIPCAATTDVPIGVLQAPCVTVGDPVEVVVSGQTQLQADASITIGSTTGLIATSADGQAQAAVAAQYVVGQAFAIAGATTAGTLITAVVDCASPVVL